MTDAGDLSPMRPHSPQSKSVNFQDLEKLLALLPTLTSGLKSGELDDALTAMEQRRKQLKWMRLPEYIILLRHGQSEGNVNQAVYTTKGDSQLELTPLGVSQAKQAGAKLRSVIEDRNVFVAVSPFERAQQTLYGLYDGGFPRQQVGVVHHDPRIREQEFGNFQSIGLSAAVRAEMKAVGRFYYRRPNAESSADVFDRVAAFWEALLSEGPTSLLCERNNTFGACLLVTHGLTIRLLLMVIFQWSVETFESVFNLENCKYITLKRNLDRCCYEFCMEKSDPQRIPWATRNVWVRNMRAEPQTLEANLLRRKIEELTATKSEFAEEQWWELDQLIDSLRLKLHGLCCRPYTVLDYLNIKAPRSMNKLQVLRMAVEGHGLRGTPEELLARPRYLKGMPEDEGISLNDIALDWWENVSSYRGKELHIYHDQSTKVGVLDTTPGGRLPMRRDTVSYEGAIPIQTFPPDKPVPPTVTEKPTDTKPT
eukprot:Rhum_TRINITY_DN5778_c0_g1::Rhum_TRINITY_DN5778_c0_g1_i1::g.18296::m.18296